MSKAEPAPAPALPRPGAVVRSAVRDLYDNSWRFLGANVLVGVLLLVVALLAVGGLAALALLPLVAVPAAGMMRMAARLVRERHADFSDVTDVLRHPGRSLLLAVVQCLVLVVLLVDMRLGTLLGGFGGTFLVVSAVYGVALWWAYAAALWPLVTDPARDGAPLGRLLRLALVVLVAHPVRIGGLLLVAGLLLAIATLLIAPVVTFAMALVWLLVAHAVLPVADRLEGRRATNPYGEDA